MYPKIMYDNLVIAQYSDISKEFVFRENLKEGIPPRKLVDFKLSQAEFLDWLQERILPENRVNLYSELKVLGMTEYYYYDIAVQTKASLLEDPYWVAFNEEDENSWRTITVRGSFGYPERQYSDIEIESKKDSK